MLNFIRNIGLPEIILIVIVLIIFIGSKKMKQVARDAGKATKEMKKVNKEYGDAVNEVKKEPVQKTVKKNKVWKVD